MKRRSTASFRTISRLILGAALLLDMCCHQPSLFSAPQSNHPLQNLHSVLSHSLLTPPLRSPEVTLRFSPNGKYLLFHDPSGVAVLSTSPLKIVFQVSAEYVYPVQFAADSESITIVSRTLSFATWKLPSGLKIASGDLPLQEGCLDGQLSPDGRFFACITPDLKFVLEDLSARKSVFEDSLSAFIRIPSGNLRPGVSLPHLSYISLDIQSVFARPFGVIRTSVPMFNPGHSLSSSSIYFTPDAKALIASTSVIALGFDLIARKRFEVSERLQKTMPGAIALLNADRAVVVEEEKDKKSKSSILSLKNGKVLANPQFLADRIHIASDPRFVILDSLESGGPSARAFDLEQMRTLDAPPNAGMDVFRDTMALYNISGFVALYRHADHQLLSTLRLPVSALPVLSAASVNPGLDQLAISVDGAGAMFQLSNGQRLASYPKFSAANSLDQQNATLVLASARHNPQRVVHATVSRGETSQAWEIPKGGVLHSNGPVLLEYSLKKEDLTARWDFETPEAQIPFRLRALDPVTGKELWKRDFGDHPPTPFADPQGDRLVLCWRAKSWGAKQAAAVNPAVYSLYKNAKLTDQDSFFESLDARTGKSFGGILVQVGSGATSFDFAFSLGDAVVLVKDGVRVSLYSLADGQLKTHLVGNAPCLSGETKLLALSLGSGRLGIYDSNGGAKLDEEFFPDEIAYTHFSSDGKRLFVLTEQQAAIILDVSRVREAPAASPATTEEKN
jgi:hypothetical protein